ncbi:hypothetical protein BH11BAC3_BH11BAC3_46260 [soil metagenome]
MKRTKLLTYASILVVVVQLSCNKEIEPVNLPRPAPPITLSEMLICHATNSWDSSTIHNKLIGKWDWKYIKCFWKPEAANNVDFKGLQVEFLPNNKLDVNENGKPTQTSTWQVTDLKDGFFKINVTPFVPLLSGRILFCDSVTLFYDSYVDGCDNYFKRTD